MTYQSPLHILESLDIKPDDLNPEGITRLRKKLLAEFNLSTEITIQIKDKSYTKDEVLKLIDKLKNLESLGIHKFIFERKKLLNWLEDDTFNTFPTDGIKETLLEFPTEEWFHTIIKDRLIDFIKLCFRRQSFDTIIRLFDFSESLYFGYNYTTHEEVYGFISQLINDIHQATSIANPTQDRLSFGFIADPKWTDFLNLLPEGFEEIRDAYLAATVNYTVAIQRKNLTFTYEISYQLFQTICNDDSLKRIIDSNNKAFESNYKRSGTYSSENKEFTFSWFYVIILLGIMRACFSYSNHTSTYSDYKLKNQSVEHPVEMQLEQSTSISTYIFSIWLYQLSLRKIDSNETPDSQQPNTGDELLKNINTTFEGAFAEENPNSTNGLQKLRFENKSKFGVIVLKAGCNENRSFYIKPQTNYDIELCNKDNLFFYFGNNWKSPKINSNDAGNQKRKLGHFLDIPKNGTEIFKEHYILSKIDKNPKITFKSVGDSIQPIEVKNIEWESYNINSKFPNISPNSSR